MAARRNNRISLRRQPQQARSMELVATILQAASEVLQKEGAHRFTTARVAEKAGVSVGAVYQYFPHKAAILFRLQSDEWRSNAETLSTVLEDTRLPPATRLRKLVHVFIRSECSEAKVRVPLNDAAPFYRDAPEARATSASTEHAGVMFMQHALPNCSAAIRKQAGNLLTTTLGAVGKRFSQSPRTAAEIDAFADAVADMFCAYLEHLARARDACYALQHSRC